MPRESPSRRNHSCSRSPMMRRSRSVSSYNHNIMNNSGGSNHEYINNSNYSRASRSRSRSRSSRHFDDEEDGCRLHVADLTDSVSQYEIEKCFRRFGDLKEVWLAKNPPCFAFIVFKRKEDASVALKEMHDRMIGNSRVKVTLARPRTRGRRRRWDPSMRCYQCGQRGHFSRDCNYDTSYSRPSYNRRRSRSRDRYSRPMRRSRTRSRSRSRNQFYRSYSRSRSPPPRRSHRSPIYSNHPNGNY